MNFPNVEEIREKCTLNGFCIVKGLISQDDYMLMRNEATNFFNKQLCNIGAFQKH